MEGWRPPKGTMFGIASENATPVARRRRTARAARSPKSRHRARLATPFERLLEPAALLEFAADAVVGVTTDGIVASWSAGAERLFGHHRSEMIGRDVRVLTPPGRTGEVDRLIDSALAGANSAPLETQRVAKDGHILTLRVAVSTVRSADGEVAGVVGVVRDMTAQRSMEGELRASEERYRSVVEALNDGVVILGRRGETLGFNQSALRIFGISAEELESGSAERPAVQLIHEDGSTFHTNELPTTATVLTGEPQTGIVMGVKQRSGGVRWIAVNSAPLQRPGEAHPFASVASFTDITPYRQTLQELKAARLEDLKRLALVSEYRDDETSRHTERVARTAQLLAIELGMDSDFVWRIARAAPLHDVGKVGIPDNVLLKPGKLTAEEFEVMKTHTSIGGRILGESDFEILNMAMEIALTHHERWDGGGYPAGLRGEEIPMSGRIVCVADAFDAMTHDRPYREAVPVADALAELRRCSGMQFDPRVVDAFLALHHEALVDEPERRRAA